MIVNYLRNYRLQWGKPDRLSLLPSIILDNVDTSEQPARTNSDLDVPTYFKADTPPELISIIMNDWPYSGTTSPSFYYTHHVLNIRLL
jgi:hypothetical protein